MIAQTPATAPAVESLARYCPATTPIFAEIANLKGLEEQWSQSDWGSALSALLFGRADDPNSGSASLAPLAAILGISDPVVARRQLLGRQAAVALPNWTDIADGVLLAVPEQVAPIEAALQAGGRKPEAAGRARQYVLDAQGHCLATDGKIVLFGRTPARTSLYQRSFALLAGQEPNALAGSADFQRELAALGPGPHRAVIYFSFPTPTATQPVTTRPTTHPTTAAATQPAPTAATQPVAATTSAPSAMPVPPPAAASQPASQPATQPAAPPDSWVPAAWPRLIQGMVGLSVDSPLIRLSVRGRLDRRLPSQMAQANISALNALPATTLAAWAQAIDYEAQYKAFTEGSPSLLRLYTMYINMRLKAAGSSLEKGLIDQLGQDSIFLVGMVPLAEQPRPVGFDLPAIGAIIPVKQPAVVASALDVIGSAFVSMLDAASIREKMAQPLEVRKAPYNGATIAEVNLGDFFKAQTNYPFAQAINLAWTVTDRDLIISTQAEHVRQILRARAGQAPPLAGKIAAAGELNHFAPGTHAVLLAQPVEIAAMFQNWLAYLAKDHPEVLNPDWWRAQHRQQSTRVNLGFRISKTQPGGVVVGEPLEGWPAYGRLQSGDLIVAADGTPLAQDDPKAALRKLIAERKQPLQITLTVERAGQRTDVTIPLPEQPAGFDPVGAMREISKLLAPFAAASYNVWCSPPDRFNARIVLRAVPQPTTRPATQPASAPATQPATKPVAPPPPPPPAPAPTTQPVATQPVATKPATAPATTRPNG